MTTNKLKALKVKLANLQLEIQALIIKGEHQPKIIDAIANDISDFTEEVTKIRKEISNIEKPKTESISLSEMYKNIKKQTN